MIDISNAAIRDVIVHRVYSSTDKVRFNENPMGFSSDEQSAVLKRIFLKIFSSVVATHEFSHKIDIDLNPLYKISKDIYGGADFVDSSRSIATHLLTSSRHPGIKDGDLFVAKFDDVVYEDTYCEAVGIYKFESRESFVELVGGEGDSEISTVFREGIGSRKADKACLILFTGQQFTVFVQENSNVESEYWNQNFLGIESKQDSVNSTSQLLSLTRSFVTDRLPVGSDFSRADQIDLLNRSAEFFKKKETFSCEVFEREVLKDAGIIDSYRSFDKEFREERGFQAKDNFSIAPQVVKKQARVFKSVLKLDRNFDVYIHGDKSLIERGVEEDGRKFYKIYYEDER